MGAIRDGFPGGVTGRSNRVARADAFIAALPLIVSVLIGPLLVGVPAAYANASESRQITRSSNLLGLPYPPANCLRHYELPTEHGWKVILAWLGGWSCPRIFLPPAKAEIWMYEGTAAPQSGPWTDPSKNTPTEPAARYGGHQRADTGARATQPAATWWEKVETVRVNRDGSWTAEVAVEDAESYTFAAVNSISRRYILVEIEVAWDDEAVRSDGTAGGSEARTSTVAAGPVVGADESPVEPLRPVGVPAAAPALVVSAALGLVLLHRARARRRR